MATAATPAAGFISTKTWRAVRRANRAGAPFVGLVVPNAYEMDPVLKSSSFQPSDDIPILDVQGRRFRFGTIGGQSVVMVMTGLSMLNAGLTTQLLLSLFKVKGIVHWGIAGNANEDLQIGDVTIPEYWAHLSLWSWQRYGDGAENKLPLEAAGDYTREFGFLNFSDYTVGKGNLELSANTLNSIWYQPEEIFPISGTPEERQHAFWVPVSKRYYKLAGREAGGHRAASVRERDDMPATGAESDTCAQGLRRQRVNRQRQLPAVHQVPIRVHPIVI
ncbi:unnamed protein product [Urochloa humidicola]